MKYVDEFRDGALARQLAQRIAGTVQRGRRYAFMEFCGGHTHAIARHGIAALLPEVIRMIHGPGCPVCVLPVGRIDQAIALALEHRAIVCSYGDTMRVPASQGLSLLGAKARGADVRMVYSAADALNVAREHPRREVVFFAIGFETTTPPTALIVRQAAAERLSNFSVLCCHVLTPPALAHIVEADAARAPGTASIDGFVGPAHVSVVIGSAPYERFEWRGLGELPLSALRIRPAYAGFDAERRFGLAYRGVPDHPHCDCAAILRGVKTPPDCRLFGRACTPESPLGACMVSTEGACAAHYAYGRFRDAPAVPA